MLEEQKSFMKKGEFAWSMIVYNLTRELEISENGEVFSQLKADSFLFLFGFFIDLGQSQLCGKVYI